MSEPQKKRTKGDLMMQLVHELGEATVKGKGDLLRRHFETNVIPQMKVGKAWHEELTDAEWEKQLAQLKSEIPQMLVYLERFAPPPPNRN